MIRLASESQAFHLDQEQERSCFSAVFGRDNLLAYPASVSLPCAWILGVAYSITFVLDRELREIVYWFI